MATSALLAGMVLQPVSAINEKTAIAAKIELFMITPWDGWKRKIIRCGNLSAKP